MSDRIYAFLAALGCSAPLTSALAAPAPSLCTADEKVIFTCQTTKAKVVSLCGMPIVEGEAGYLQYRIGALGKPPEMVHPMAKSQPKDGFQYGTLLFASAGGAFVQFSKGSYKYVTYSASGKGWDKAGVSVTQAGKLVANVVCKQGDLDIDLGFIEREGVPRTKDEFELP